MHTYLWRGTYSLGGMLPKGSSVEEVIETRLVRDLEDRSSGNFSKQFRDLAGPIHKGRGRGKKSQGKGKGEGKGEGKGYEPQQGQAHANRHWGQDP